MTHDEIEEMLGVYALDALDADERQEIDDHLASCPRCRAELAAHREVAALLGNPVGDAAAVAPDAASGTASPLRFRTSRPRSHRCSGPGSGRRWC